MIIYGVAVLAACFIAGQALGLVLGQLLGTGGNVGGVGIAMCLLIVVNDRLRRRGWLGELGEAGIAFWGAIYIPVIIAMSATTNVRAALSGGWAALLIGVGGTALCFGLVPLLTRLARRDERQDSLP